MKKINTLAFIAAALIALAGNTTAAIIFQTHNYSNINNTGATQTWNQFNSTLGELTSVTFTLDGSLTGSFTVTSTDEISGLTASGPQSRLVLQFLGSSPKPANVIGTYSPFTTTPSTVLPNFSIDPLGSQAFTINQPAVITPYTSTNLVSFSSYFVGSSTLDTKISRTFTLSLSGGSSAQDYSTALASGVVSLTYTYSPTSAVPEPGTWAAAAMLLGGVGIARWRKRSSEK